MTDRTEADRLLNSAAVSADLKQLDRLLKADLSLAEIAHRMAIDERELRHTLKLLKVEHEELATPMPRRRKARKAG